MSLKSKISIIGIGQCGNQIAKEFDTLNYNTFYVNTSNLDFPNGIPEDRKFLIDGSKGSAKDRQRAIEFGINSFEDIINNIEGRFPLASICYFVFSGGGGSGSGISPFLLDMISSKYPDKKYCAVMVLPSKDESILSHNNAKECLNQLLGIKDKLYSIHLLDNNKRTNFLEINQEFAILLDSIVSFEQTTEKGNIDEEELEQLITDSGFTSILEFDEEDFKVGLSKAVSNSIYADWTSDSNYLGLILNNSFDKTIALNETEEEFGVPITDFTSYTNESTKIISTGMSFNKEILRKLNINIKEKLARKQELESRIEDDEEELEEVSISSILKKKPNKKKSSNTNVSKELESILNKYKNM